MVTIFVGVHHKGNRTLLKEWLSEYYIVIEKESFPTDEHCDLYIVDGVMLSQRIAELRQLKEKSQNIFVPVMLIAEKNDVGLAQNNLWHTIDELIFVPIKKIELQARIHSLLQTRELSIRLKEEEARVKSSEGRFAAAFNVGPAGMTITRLSDGTFRDVNESFLKMFEYTREELVGRTSVELGMWTPEERERLIRRQIETGGITTEELVARTKSGKQISLLFSSRQIELNGEPHLITTLIDITDRKQAEAMLLLHRAAVQSAANAIVITDRDGKIISVNNAFTQMTGYSEEEVIGKTPRILKSGKHPASFYKNLWNTILSGNVWKGEIHNKRKDGSVYIENMTITPFQQNVGEISYFIAIKEDINERKKLENQMLQIQKVEGIGTLAGGIAHDFNNILGIILAYLSILERNRDNTQKFEEALKVMNNAVARGSALVRQILTFARQSEVLIQPLSLSEVAHEVVTMLRETFPKIIEFVEQYSADIPWIEGDHTQLHQAVLNLCVNARDAMPNGGTITIGIDVRSQEEIKAYFPQALQERYVHLSVSDTGIGMDEETKRKIFDPFFTTKEKGKGTGLGLSVVFGVVQSHNGFISVDSVPGVGTTFHIYVPVPKEFKNIPHHEEAKPVALKKGEETILFVEDEEDLRELVVAFLEENGYKVLSSGDGQNALELYREHSNDIHLVLTDMGLPKLIGSDLSMLLKKINPNVKVLIASGYISAETKTKLVREGVSGFIQKPYNLNDVLRKIREVLDQ